MILKKALKGFYGLAALGFFTAMIRNTAYNGFDFNVYFEAAQALLHGQSPYSLDQEQSWPFKYPPWVLTFFLPFSLFSMTTAKWLFGITQAFVLFDCCRRLTKITKSIHVVFWSAICFWFLWAYHSLAGQFTILILYASIVLQPQNKLSCSQKSILALAMSGKIFSIFPLLRYIKLYLNPKTLFNLIGLMLLFTLPLLYWAPIDWPMDWINALQNKGHLSLKVDSWSWRNQSFIAGLFRIFQFKPESSLVFGFAFFISAFIFGVWWNRISQKRSKTEVWFGWVALSAVVQPLAWFHTFVLAFPLVTLAIQDAYKTRNYRKIILCFFGVCSINFFTYQSLGEFGNLLQMISIKSIGVLLCLKAISLPSKVEQV